MSAAERQRRYRARQSKNRRMYSIEVPDWIIELLINQGRLTDDESQDRKHVAIEAAALIEERARQIDGNFPLRVTRGRS